MKVKVWNDNVHPYKEQFREHAINIPAKGFIYMELDDANTFKGTYCPRVMDHDGRDDPKGFKMIRIEQISAEELAADAIEKHNCIACKYEAPNGKDLAEHVKMHAADLVVDEEAEAFIKAKKGKKAS